MKNTFFKSARRVCFALGILGSVAFGQAPSFSTRPLTQAVLAGQSVTVHAPASGVAPLTYQWKRNGQVVAGASSATLSLSSATLADRGAYQVIVSNVAGTATSVFMLDVGLAATTVVKWGSAGISPPSDLGPVLSVKSGPAAGSFLALRTDRTVAGWGTNSTGQTTVPAGLNQVVAVAGTNYSSVALKADGTVVTWGGSGLSPPPGVAGIVAISGGGDHVLALKSDGTVVAWGNNYDQQCNVPVALRNVIGVAAGGSHSLALLGDRTVVSWGSGSGGQTSVPTGLTDVVAISAGQMHNLALRASGQVVAWGSDYSGSTQVPPAGLSGVIAVSAGAAHSLALKFDGTVLAWGRLFEGQTQVPEGLSGAFAITAAEMQSLAIVASAAPSIQVQPVAQATTVGDYVTLSVTTSGTVPFSYVWKRTGNTVVNGGRISGATTATLVLDGITAADAGNYVVEVSNAFGITPSAAAAVAVNVPPTLVARPRTRLATIGQPATFTVAATDPGSITYQWKRNGQVVAGATGASLTLPAVSATDRGFYEVIVANPNAAASSFFRVETTTLPTAGAFVMSWGTTFDNYGQLTPPAGLTDVVAVAAGKRHAAALRANGTVTAWGYSGAYFGQPADLTDAVAVAVSEGATLAVRADGRVVKWGDEHPSYGVTIPPGLRGIVDIAARETTVMALKSDGTVVSWSGLTPPAGLNQVVAIATGSSHHLALKSDGTVAAWGYTGSNSYGQAIAPAGLTGVTAIGAGDAHSMALKSDGSVVAWGAIAQHAVPAGLTQIVALEGGRSHGVALRSDGTAVAWGVPHNDRVLHETPRVGGIIALEAHSDYNLAVAVPLNPTFVQPPASRTVNTGESVTLAARVVSAPLATLQWRKNGEPISGATNASLTFATPQASDSGTYTLVATTSQGMFISAGAMLSVVTPLAVTVRPLSKLVAAGQPVSFVFEATGAVSYQWKRNGEMVAGATTGTLTRASATLADRGYYEAVATGAGGATARAVVQLIVAGGPTYLQSWNSDGTQQLDAPGDVRNAAMISGIGGSGGALRADGTVVTWGNFSPGMPPAGLSGVVSLATGGSHSIALKGDGTVVIFGGGGYSETNVPAGLSNVVAVAASGYNSLALRGDGTVVRWGYDYYNSHAVPAGLANVVAIAAGAHHSLALKSDGTVVTWGQVNSGSIVPPALLTDVVAISAAGGSCGAIRRDGSCVVWGEVDAAPTGLGPVRALSVGYNNVLALKPDGTLTAWGRTGYAAPVIPPGIANVVALSAGGGVGLALVAGTPAAPTIVSAPTSQSVDYGATATFSVNVTGTPVMAYRWLKGDQPYFSATATGTQTSTLTLSNVQSTDAGNYSVTITNNFGSVTVNNLVLTVITHAVVPSGPAVVGGNVTFSVNATGATGYQWRYRGVPIAGATNATLTLSNLTRGSNGAYDVVLAYPSRTIVAHAYNLDVRPATLPDLYVADADFTLRLEQAGAGGILAALPLPDGKFLVGGDFIRLGAHPAAYLARLNANGTVDATFAPPPISGPVRTLLRQADGRILVGGDFAFVNGQRSGGLFRLESGLAVDTTFAVGQGFDGPVLALAQQVDGKIVVGGEYSRLGTDTANRIVRLNVTGSRDPDFTYINTLDPVRAIRIQADGRIVLGGGRFSDGSSGTDGFLLRLLATGGIDPEWGGVYRPYAPVLAILPETDGGWMIAGAFSGVQTFNGYSGYVLRLAANGAHDTSFALDPSLRIGVRDISILAAAGGGKYFVAGDGLAPVRLTSTGARDATQPSLTFTEPRLSAFTHNADSSLRLWGRFGETSIVTGSSVLAADGTSFGAVSGEVPRAAAEVFQAENVGANQVLLRGSFTHVNDVPRTTLVRLDGSGAVDASFVPGTAFASTDTGRFAVQGDGRILAHTGTALVRLEPSGAIDPSWTPLVYQPGDLALDRDGFGLIAARGVNNGLAATPVIRRLGSTGVLDSSFVVTHSGMIQDIVVQASGRILLGGSFSMLNGVDSIYPPVRLLPSGARDVSFVWSYNEGYRILAGAGDWAYLIAKDNYPARILRLEGDRYSSTFSFDLSSANGVYGAAAALLPLPDGKLLRASVSSADTVTKASWLLGRHLVNGAHDPAFQADGLDRLRTRITRMLLADDASFWLFGRHLTAFGAPRFGAMRLAVALPAAIVTPPVAAQALPGGSATFSVGATGTGPLTYQWFRDGTRLPDATRAMLTLDNLTLRDVAGYSVRVTNAYNAVTSAPAQLTGLNPIPTVSTHPASQIAVVGNPVTFAVAASGTGPLVYQWRRSGHPLPGATDAQFTLTNPTRTDAGFYDVQVADGLSVKISDVAQLDVAPSSYPNQLSFDPTFAPRFETVGGTVQAIVAAPGGRFIVSGDFSRINGLASPGLARLDASLQPDPSFTPPVELADSTTSFSAIAVVRVHAMQADGKILVTQPLPAVGEYPFRNKLVRLLADGSVDPTFTASAEPQNIVGLALQPDGQIVVYGLQISTALPAGKRYVYRLKVDGSLDASYAPIFRTSSEVAAPTCLVVQPDGRAIFGGPFVSVDGQATLGLVRLTSAGALDATFTVSGASYVAPTALALQPDGRLLVGGSFTIPGITSASLVRFSGTGAVESVLLQWPAVHGATRRILPLADGRIWAAAREPNTSSSQATMVRLTSAGVVERTATTWVTGIEWGFAAIDADRLLITAKPENATGIVRLGSDGNPDGMVANVETLAGVQSVVPAAGGKLYATGAFTRVNGTPQAGFTRLNSDGSLDAAFSPGTGFNVPPAHLVGLADGRLMASGSFSSYRSIPARTTIRLLAGGNLDPSFTSETLDNGFGASGRPVQLADGRVFMGADVCFSADGTLDRSFQPGASASVGAVALRDHGVLAANHPTSSSRVLSRVRADGSVAATTFVNVDRFSAVALQPGGKILAAGGRTTSGGGHPTQLLRFNADLTADDAFLFSGAPSPPFATISYRGPQLLVQEDGRIILNDYYRFGRVLADGAWDDSFTLSGVGVIQSFEGRGARVMLLRDDGSVLLGDDSFMIDGLRRRGVVRFVDRAAAVIGNRPGDPTLVAGDALTLAIAATGPGDLSYQWLRNGGAIPGATTATYHVAVTSVADAGHYSVNVTNANGTVRSAAGIVRVAPAVAPVFVQQPLAQSAAAGQSVRLTALAAGAPAPAYQWFKDGAAIPGETRLAFTLAGMTADHVGNYTVEAVNRVGRVLSNPARLSLLPAGFAATHEWVAPFVSNRVTIRSILSYPGTPGVSWQVLLPETWSYRASSVETGVVQPAAGTTGLIEFRWTAAPAGPLSFTYELEIPAGPLKDAELVALVGVSDAAETLHLLARPDPLPIRRRHGADTNGDSAVDLFELTRVIELYNTRHGTVRTGAYRVDATNLEDGFGADSPRAAGATVALTRYHSADTRGATTGSPRDGALDLFELTRVIELYNTRAGTVRTGRYHVLEGTEDGFAAGP